MFLCTWDFWSVWKFICAFKLFANEHEHSCRLKYSIVKCEAICPTAKVWLKLAHIVTVCPRTSLFKSFIFLGCQPEGCLWTEKNLATRWVSEKQHWLNSAQVSLWPFQIQSYFDWTEERPSSFQRLMSPESTLGDLRYQIYSVYLDDIIIYSMWKQHFLDLQCVLDKLRQAKLIYSRHN